MVLPLIGYDFQVPGTRRRDATNAEALASDLPKVVQRLAGASRDQGRCAQSFAW